MRLILAVLLLAACSGSAPTTYQRGTPTIAPVFVPSQDAPHRTGQPGHVRPPHGYPRSPNRRVLPPERGPGLWSADRPRAARPTTHTTTERLAGLLMPIPDAPEDVEPDLHYWADKCAEVGSLFLTGERADVVEALTPVDKACLASTLYASCASSLLEITDKGHGRQVGANERAAIETLRLFAMGIQKKTCGRPDAPDIVAELAQGAGDDMYSVLQEVHGGYLH